MRQLILSIAVILGVVIQATWLGSLHLPGHVTPDLILIMTISYGLLKGSDDGLVFGLCAGLFLDLIAGGLIGIKTISKLAAGFAAGFMEKNIFKDNLLVPIIAVFIGTIVFESFSIIMYIAFKANLNFFTIFIARIIPLAFINALIAPIIYYFLLRLERFLAERAR